MLGKARDGSVGDMDLRDLVPYPSQILEFQMPLSDFRIQNQLHPDKAQLRNTILALRAQGMSYRKIALRVGLHWTRVQQIVKSAVGRSATRMPEE
jgi:hypothetical protein